MKTIGKNIILITLFLSYFAMCALTQEKFRLVNFPTEDGGNIEAALFEGGQDQVVIFAHGMVFNKESWYFLAEKFQSAGITALSIDFRGYGKSKAPVLDNKFNDILGAISYLEGLEFKEINIIGGSMGSMAALYALNMRTDPQVQKVILLAPPGGPPIASDSIKKLFVVSKGEGLYEMVKTIFENSSEPKELKEYEGSAHAQHMFKTDYAEELVSIILKFIIQ